ncbi:hypothetical protein RchiOBHm_Chr2g0139981 [Rosa chinensis]|uniref:Uncharacterized protein n=1 Tax=Rosa chinensis TaxID=74649 RepID=A0A2P6RXB4_ROSCH|nr:hypothetical protein RchiOBHm_Chr2g0139981 [Rosa chinensis]
MDILCQQRRASDVRNMLKSFGGRKSTELLSLTPKIDEIDYETTTMSERPRVVLEQEFEMLFEGITHPGSDQYDCEIGMGRMAINDQPMEDFTVVQEKMNPCHQVLMNSDNLFGPDCFKSRMSSIFQSQEDKTKWEKLGNMRYIERGTAKYQGHNNISCRSNCLRYFHYWYKSSWWCLPGGPA